MGFKKIGRAAAWGVAILMAAVTSLFVWALVLLAQDRQWIDEPFNSNWCVGCMVLLMAVPWGTVIAALIIRERTGRRLR